ncbi:MAG: hypothetical protein KF799_09945 [Bdellovibrionales bacterium]|nr:hypothetical protein [Bdellovibrionales bacterium]
MQKYIVLSIVIGVWSSSTAAQYVRTPQGAKNPYRSTSTSESGSQSQAAGTQSTSQQSTTSPTTQTQTNNPDAPRQETVNAQANGSGGIRFTLPSSTQVQSARCTSDNVCYSVKVCQKNMNPCPANLQSDLTVKAEAPPTASTPLADQKTGWEGALAELLRQREEQLSLFGRSSIFLNMSIAQIQQQIQRDLASTQTQQQASNQNNSGQTSGGTSGGSSQNTNPLADLLGLFFGGLR